MDDCLGMFKLHLSEDWSTDITQLFWCARVIVGENTAIDVCLAVRKLHFSDAFSVDMHTRDCGRECGDGK